MLHAPLREHGLFSRYWVLCLLEAATHAGLAPSARPQLFALAYFANALADTFHSEAIQRVVLRSGSGPRLADVAIELDRLTGLGLCRVTRVTGGGKAAVLKSQYFAADMASRHLDEVCRNSEHLKSIREFHHLVATGFSDLGVPNIVRGSTEEASYSDLSVGEGEIVDLGGLQSTYPTLLAIKAVQDALPSFRSKSAFAAVQVYGRFLAQVSEASSSGNEVSEGVPI